MKASVIIPTKNPGDIFHEVLTMVLSQETDFPYEILVIDSGSTDGTIAYIKQHPTVRLHQIEPLEFGHGKTRNQAIAMTSGEFIAMLTHDVGRSSDEARAVYDDIIALIEAEVIRDQPIAPGHPNVTAAVSLAFGAVAQSHASHSSDRQAALLGAAHATFCTLLDELR